MRVLLTGARAPVTLDLARRFHAAGHTVYLADSLQYGIASSTRAARGMRCLPSPRASLSAFTAALLDAIRVWKIDLLIPTCEEAFFIALRLDVLRGACRVFTDPIDKLERIHNKWKFSQASYSRDVRAPESHLLSEAGHLQPFLTEAAEWVFKPVYSRFASHTKVGPSAAEVLTIEPTPACRWIAQRRIFGVEHSTYGVAHAGRLRAHVIYRSAYRVGLGSGIYFSACAQPAIEQFVRDFVAAESTTGQIAFDFIVDGDGRAWVLEANPRATSGAHLFGPRDGLIDALLTADGECIHPSGQEPHMVAMAMALYGLREAIRRRALGTFLRDVWRARDVIHDWRDPLPTLLMPLAFAEIAAVALRQRLAMTEATTYDIEWNGEPL